MYEEQVCSNHFWEQTILNLYFSSDFYLCGSDIGQAVANWLQQYEAAVEELSPETARRTLTKYVPEGGAHSIVAMKPEQHLLWNFKGLPFPIG